MNWECDLEVDEIGAKKFLDSKIKEYLKKRGRCGYKYMTYSVCSALDGFEYPNVWGADTVASANIIFDEDVTLEKLKENIVDALSSSYGSIPVDYNSITWSMNPKKKTEKQKEKKDMGLKIKKTDVLSIEEFKENTKAYDEIKINIDNEKLKKFEEDYGVYDFTIYLCRYVKICDEVIEFLPKALCIGSVHCVPYEFIENIECTYYLETGK